MKRTYIAQPVTDPIAEGWVDLGALLGLSKGRRADE